MKAPAYKSLSDFWSENKHEFINGCTLCGDRMEVCPVKAPDGKNISLYDYYKTKALTREDVTPMLDDYYGEKGVG